MGRSFSRRLIQSVEGAARSVDIQVFIFSTDDYAVKIAGLLKQRSSAVKVRVLLDDAGTLFAGDITGARRFRWISNGPATSGII